MSAAHPESLLRFVARFDSGQYWLAHEDLEELWLADRQDLYKGLIQAAAALLHAQRGNWRGAAAKARHAIEHVDGAGASAFDVNAVLEKLRNVVIVSESLAAAGGGIDEQAFERVRFELAPSFAGAGHLRDAPSDELPYRVRRHADGYRLGRDPRRRD